MTEKIHSIQSEDVGRDIAKLRYKGYYAKRRGSTIYFSREAFELIPPPLEELLLLYEQESLGTVQFPTAEEAAKALKVVKYKMGTHPILTLSQMGILVSVILRKPPAVELNQKPTCFTLWVRALKEHFKGGALIILNKNLRRWGEKELSLKEFEDLVYGNRSL